MKNFQMVYVQHCMAISWCGAGWGHCEVGKVTTGLAKSNDSLSVRLLLKKQLHHLSLNWYEQNWILTGVQRSRQNVNERILINSNEMGRQEMGWDGMGWDELMLAEWHGLFALSHQYWKHRSLSNYGNILTLSNCNITHTHPLTWSVPDSEEVKVLGTPWQRSDGQFLDLVIAELPQRQQCTLAVTVLVRQVLVVPEIYTNTHTTYMLAALNLWAYNNKIIKSILTFIGIMHVQSGTRSGSPSTSPVNKKK